MFRDKIAAVQRIDMTADELVSALVALADDETVCLLDSCGVDHLGSHLLIAGIDPIETFEVSPGDHETSLALLDEKLSGRHAAIFTISYDLGLTMLGIDSPDKGSLDEPAVFISIFDSLIIYDYNTGIGHLTGNRSRFPLLEKKLASAFVERSEVIAARTDVRSNFTRSGYLSAIEEIKELIRSGDTYQTNLTQQLTANLADKLTAGEIFRRLRRDHPAPFAAFLRRGDSSVVSISPERFFCVDEDRRITTSPIKGTSPRSAEPGIDRALRQALLESEKDRAENTMIVDLLRNDIGRVCEFGSIKVERLCEIEEHPTFFHLVSTISGDLRPETSVADILRAVFPCGSITGAPKISTMHIIEDIENRRRGLSMGAIGYYVPGGSFGLPKTLDLSVAIRTMVVRSNVATFNVGGGIVIDSEPATEYDESLTKAKALLAAIGGRLVC